MYWMQWSRSAGLLSGPFLSMMRIADSCVVMLMLLMSSIRFFDQRMELHRRFDRGLRSGTRPGSEILKSTFSIT